MIIINEVIKGENNKEVPLPTVGFNVESIKYRGHQLAIFDLGGQDTTRNLWQHHYVNTRAIIFVIDSSDHNRILPDDDKKEEYNLKSLTLGSVREEIIKLLNEPQLRHCKNYLIFANKQDIDNALSPFDLEAKLGLRGYQDKNLHFQASSAKNKTGITQGMDWLINALYKNN